MPLIGCETADNGGMGECQSPDDCDDDNECTEDACESGMCTNNAVDDGAICEAGVCRSGVCEPLTSIFPCTEQGIRDAIEEGGGPHGFACDGPRTVVPELPIDIDTDVILDGERKLTVDGDVARVGFSVVRDVTAELRRFAVENGWRGIHNNGTLSVTDTTISGASNPVSRDDFGGGIENHGTLTLVSSTVSGNSAGLGGGIFSGQGTLTVVNSAVSGNTATSGVGSAGGGIHILGGAATLTNSTVWPVTIRS
jgi:hypothetical protein